MKATPTSVGEYLRNETSKANRTQKDNKINKLTDHFAQLERHEHLNEMEPEGKALVSRTIQSPRYMNTKHYEARRKSGNRTKAKSEHSKQIHNDEKYTMVRLG